MERQIQLELRQPNNKFKKFTQDFVPFSKRQEYIRLEKELEEKFGSEVPESEYTELQAKFVAGLFEDEKVTAEAIMNGLDTLDRDKIYEIVRYRVLGYSKEQDEQIKKAMLEEVLPGESSTTSNLNLSEK